MMPLWAQIAGLFTTPVLATAGALAVGIPVAIHLLSRLRRQTVPWGAMQFLLQAYRQQKRRLQMEQLLLLLVRCLIVLLLGLALSEPLLGGLEQLLGAGGGRLVCVVLDDSLTTRARAGEGDRYDPLQQQLEALVNELGTDDRIALWRAGRPWQRVLAPTMVDPAGLRQMLTQFKPRYGASDLLPVLQDVARTVRETQTPLDRCFVVVLSDFSVGSADLTLPRPAELGELAQHAQWLLSHPAGSSPNVQIKALRPLRSRLFTDTRAPAALPVQVELRRFVEDSADLPLTLEVLVHPAAPGNAQPEPLASIRRPWAWTLGQREATLNVELPLPAGAPAGALTVTAHLLASNQADALAADDQRQAVVTLAHHLRVGLIEPRGLGGAGAAGKEFSPADWLRLALSPAAGVIETRVVEPNAVNPAALGEFDACFVLRPDLLSTPALDALHQFVTTGGVAVFTAPNVELPAVWGAAVLERFNLPWRMQVEPQQAPAADASAPAIAGEGIALKLDQATPPALRLLSADWRDLQRPVRVQRWLRLMPAAGEENSGVGDAWLTLATTPAQPLLVQHPVGDGAAVLLATALDSAWSNLPTKPLFVPLWHESLRGLLGAAQHQPEVEAGATPALGRAFHAVAALTSPTGQTIALRLHNDLITPTTPLETPGLYRASQGDSGALLAVNVSADAGDTATLEPRQLAAWLANPGRWTWLHDQPAHLWLQQQLPRTNLGQPLLWAVVALLILETCMARWFSHAKSGGRSWGAHLLQWSESLWRGVHPSGGGKP